mgnify:CR=1 FL=1
MSLIKKVKATLFVDVDLLKAAFLEDNSDDEYSLELACRSEIHWVNDSGILLDALEITEDKVSAVLSVDEAILRDAFLECNDERDYSFDTAFAAEMNWVNDSGIILGDFEVIEDKSGD